jgi:hypothetical protein
MARPDQKLSERQTLDAVFAALDLRRDQEPKAGETPDFTVLISGRTIGVEITTYQSEATVDGRHRAQESRKRVVGFIAAGVHQHGEIPITDFGILAGAELGWAEKVRLP